MKGVSSSKSQATRRRSDVCLSSRAHASIPSQEKSSVLVLVGKMSIHWQVFSSFGTSQCGRHVVARLTFDEGGASSFLRRNTSVEESVSLADREQCSRQRARVRQAIFRRDEDERISPERANILCATCLVHTTSELSLDIECGRGNITVCFPRHLTRRVDPPTSTTAAVSSRWQFTAADKLAGHGKRVTLVSTSQSDSSRSLVN